MSKFKNYALLGAVGLVVLASGAGIDFSERKPTASTAKALVSDAPTVERLVDAEQAAKVEAASESEPAPRTTTAPVSRKEMAQIDDMIAATINLSGNLCAQPIEVRDAGDGLFGVRCVTNRNGTGISDYIVNSRTSEVIPI